MSDDRTLEEVGRDAMRPRGSEPYSPDPERVSDRKAAICEAQEYVATVSPGRARLISALLAEIDAVRERERSRTADLLAAGKLLKRQEEREAKLREALREMRDAATTCQNDPEVPCAEAELDLWDDWCWPCYTKEIARAALADGEGET